jgi:hypothetical protein
MGTGISIARSQFGDKPADGNLANGELAYSFSSNKLWIGQTNNVNSSVTNEYIGGALLVDKVANLESSLFGPSGLEAENITLQNTATIDSLILSTGTVNGVLYRQANGLIGFASGSRGQFLTYDGNGDISFASSLDGFEVQDVAIFQANVTIDGVLLSDNDVYANNVYIRSRLQVNGDIILRGDNITLGDGGDVISLGASVNTSIIPTTSNAQSLGSNNNIWNAVYANKFIGDGSSLSGVVSTANLITLGTPTEDGSVIDGAVTSLTANTSTLDAIDRLNEAMFNISKNTFVRDVAFSASPTSGGAGTNVTLTITATGNPNEYSVNWGDGQWSNNITATNPSHVYATNTNSPFTVEVYARNTSATGEGSNAEFINTDMITIYVADPVANFDVYNNLTGPSIVTEANTGQAVYLENTTTNIANSSATATFAVNWGDGGAEVLIPSKVSNGGPQGARLSKTYSSDSGTGTFNVNLYQNTYSIGNPSIFPLNRTKTIKVFDIAISAPNNIGSKTLSWASSSDGTSPKLAAGFIGSGKSAGDSISTSFPRTTGSAVLTSAMSSYFHTTGTPEGHVNDADASAITVDETSVDYYNYNAAGVAVAAAARIYAEGLYTTGTKARLNLTSAIVSSTGIGVNKAEISTPEGNSNELYYVYDPHSNSPTVDVSSATVTEATASYNYISGIPYYDTGDTLTLSGIVVTDLIGQTYRDTNSPFSVSASNIVGTTGTAFGSTYTYATALNSSQLTGGIPNANNLSASLNDLTITIGSGDRAAKVMFTAHNVNGYNNQIVDSPIIQCFTGNPSFNELLIPVSDDLGATFDSDGLRISGFSGANPSFNSATDYYSNNFWNGAVTVAGTDEAIVRYNLLEHFTTDLSSGYLPAGPDLSTGRSGTQYFRFAFKRTNVANVRFTLTGKVSGFYIAAPGTAIDSASGLSGWLDASIQYAGSGVPGSDTANGGNGSNGCALTGADRIIDGTSYSNQNFDLTLGTENLSNATNNLMLVSIALNSDDSISSLSVGEVS